MSLSNGRWTYDPVQRKYVFIRNASIVKAPDQNLDQTIERLAAQGMAMIVVAGILWFVRELAKSWES